jgi:ribosomal protein L14
MKQLLLFFCFGFFALNLSAQQVEKMKSHKHSTTKDCVMMDNGKMMMMKHGQTMDFTKEMTLKNGTLVMTDGTIKRKNGTSVQLKDGDCIMMDGKVTHNKEGMKKEKMKM